MIHAKIETFLKSLSFFHVILMLQLGNIIRVVEEYHTIYGYNYLYSIAILY